MAARDTWVATLLQTLPRLGGILTRLEPSFELPSVAAVDAGFLSREGIAGVIWDVDGTLMPHHDTRVLPDLEEGFRAALATPNVRHVIVSNAGDRRFRELGRIFPDLPVLQAFPAEDRIVYRKLLGEEEEWSEGPREGGGAVVGVPARRRDPNGPSALRKPNALLVEFALRELGGPPRDRVLVVGDQYYTDIAGANLAGVRSAKVPTLERASFPPAVRAFQRLEQLAYPVLRPLSRRRRRRAASPR